MWPDRRLLDLFKTEHPIVLAPMAGAMDTDLAIAVAQAGGLGSLPVAMLDEQKMRAQMAAFRAATTKPINLNFFAHKPPELNNAREHAWRERLKPYYMEFGVDPAAPVPSSNRTPFDGALCAAVEEIKPEVVSFHYGLPEAALLEKGKRCGLCRDEFGDDSCRSALAGSERLRCGHRTRLRGRWPSWHVLDRQSRCASRHIRAGATDRRRHKAARDCYRWGHRCARHRGGVSAWGVRRATGHSVSILPGVKDLGASPHSAKSRARRWDCADQCNDRTAGPRLRESRDA